MSLCQAQPQLNKVGWALFSDGWVGIRVQNNFCQNSKMMIKNWKLWLKKGWQEAGCLFPRGSAGITGSTSTNLTGNLKLRGARVPSNDFAPRSADTWPNVPLDWYFTKLIFIDPILLMSTSICICICKYYLYCSFLYICFILSLPPPSFCLVFSPQSPLFLLVPPSYSLCLVVALPRYITSWHPEGSYHKHPLEVGGGYGIGVLQLPKMPIYDLNLREIRN